MITIKFHILRTAKHHLSLIGLTLFCISLILIRVKITGTTYYMFLIWNLFLAALPLYLSTLIYNFRKLNSTWYLLYPALAVWLLLLPNAPYLITDFKHFKHENSVPFWFDLLLLASFSICGLLFGLASIKNIHLVLAKKWNKNTATLIIASICLLSGLGLYIGRFLRYNSWDILHRPIAIITDVVQHLTHTDTVSAPIGITLGFGIFQFLLFDLYNTSAQ